MNFKKIIMPVLLIFMISCGQNPFSSDPLFMLGIPELASIPVDVSDCRWIGPFGNIYGEGGTIFMYHDGIDFNTVNYGRFLSCVDGTVIKIELDTGKGLPGTNYRIIIKASSKLELDYHFETGGSVSEEEMRSNIFVSVGERVKAGQNIANLIVLSDGAHVHFGVYEKGKVKACPVNYFSQGAADLLEQLYDLNPRVYDHSLNPDLCN